MSTDFVMGLAPISAYTYQSTTYSFINPSEIINTTIVKDQFNITFDNTLMVEMVAIHVPVLPIRHMLIRYTMAYEDDHDLLFFNMVRNKLGNEWTFSDVILPLKEELRVPGNKTVIAVMVPQTKTIYRVIDTLPPPPPPPSQEPLVANLTNVIGKLL